MKEAFKDLYGRSMGYTLLFLLIFNTVLAGSFFKGPLGQLATGLDTEENASVYRALCLVTFGIISLVQDQTGELGIQARAFSSKYILPTSLILLPFMDSFLRFSFTFLKWMYGNEDHKFLTYYFVWIPLLGLLYLYHRHLARVYEKDYSEET